MCVCVNLRVINLATTAAAATAAAAATTAAANWPLFVVTLAASVTVLNGTGLS